MQERVKAIKKAKRPKRRVTLAIDATLAAAAEAKGIDLTTTLEQSLLRLLGQTAGGGLTEVERANLDWAERYVAQHGPWWDQSEKD